MSTDSQCYRRASKLKRDRNAQHMFIVRRYIVSVLFIILGAILITGAWYKQIHKAGFLQKQGERKHYSKVKVPARRGRILDRKGKVLAVSTPVDSIYLNPQKIKHTQEAITALAKALKKNTDEIQDLLSKYYKRHFAYVERHMSPSAAHAALTEYRQSIQKSLENAKQDNTGVESEMLREAIRAVDIERTYRRYYPAAEIFSHVVGFSGRDDKGQEGIELQYEQHLGAHSGEKLVLRDAKRQLIENVASLKLPRPGQDISLTLDRRIQFYAYTAMKRAIKKHKARSASLIMLDTKNGEILAMVNLPSYNPNGSRSNAQGRLRNRAIVDLFEPGSTMKPMTIAAALQLDYIDEDSVIDGRTTSIKVAGHLIKDPKSYGVMDPAAVLRHSSNVGAAKIALKMPPKAYWQQLSNLGFGKEIGIGFPGEAKGMLRHFTKWYRIDHANLAFGYGISTSTLQLASAYSVIANDGLKLPIKMIKQQPEQSQARRVLDKDVAQKIRYMLEGVVTKGTAPLAGINGYRVAGKTGTVKLISNRVYQDDKFRAIFAGMAPVSNPRLVAVIMFEQPQGKKYHGGQVAAPVFSEVVGYALRLLNVAPDKKTKQQDMLRLATVGDLS